MPDSDSSPRDLAVQTARDYRTDAHAATHSLGGLLRQKIMENGPISFVDFMGLALYQPDLGYYACGTRQVGRRGDFFTSVSVGPLFGKLLARRFLREWRTLGEPVRWRIIECGAHDGTLAGDILGEIFHLDSQAFAALEYVISEPLPRLQSAQYETLVEHSLTVRIVDDLEILKVDPLPGVVFGNELLDALPFHVIERKSGRWCECRVTVDEDKNFCWEIIPEIHDPALKCALGKLGDSFPDGYRTEVRTRYREFLEPFTRCISTGLMLWPDYGFARPEYYSPDRKSGTLRTFSNHRAAENPLAAPGEIDITAHVDFTAVAEAALEIGAMPMIFRNQGSWLTEQAHDWLLAFEGNPDVESLRQFQTLTHPAHLGASFHVLEITWKQPMKEISRQDRHRLALSACSVPKES